VARPPLEHKPSGSRLKTRLKLTSAISCSGCASCSWGNIPAVGASDNERKDLLGLLGLAHGFTVFDQAGRRVGTFIELADASGEKIAIRHDAVFLWRRRVLPVSTVASVSPEHGTVVLGVDRGALETMDAASARLGEGPDENVPLAHRDEDSEVPWRLRMEGYLAGPATVRGAGSSETAANDAEQYLLFVSTADGYRLLELHGQAPAATDYVHVPEHDGLFWVAKLGASPLPNDRRVCAYLERTD
jgi:hypothetical protein